MKNEEVVETNWNVFKAILAVIAVLTACVVVGCGLMTSDGPADDKASLAEAATDAPKATKSLSRKGPRTARIVGDLQSHVTDHSACLAGTPTLPVSQEIVRDVDILLASQRAALIACFQAGNCRLETQHRKDGDYAALVTTNCTTLPWEPSSATVASATQGGVR